MTTLLVILLASMIYFAVKAHALRTIDDEDAITAEIVED